MRCLVVSLDAGLHLAFAGTQIGAEPGDDKRDAFEIGTGGLQLVERGLDVGDGVREVPVLGLVLPCPRHPHDGRGLITELGGAGNERAPHAP